MNDINELSYKIRGAIYTVHNEPGPGLLESVYVAALTYELSVAGIFTSSQVSCPVQYKEVYLELGFRMDILVDGIIVIEVKSIEALHDVHKKQLLTYLRLADKQLGIFVNFNVAKLIDKE